MNAKIKKYSKGQRVSVALSNGMATIGRIIKFLWTKENGNAYSVRTDSGHEIVANEGNITLCIRELVEMEK